MPDTISDRDPYEQIRTDRVPDEATRQVIEHIVNVGSDERRHRINMFRTATELSERLQRRHEEHESSLKKMAEDFQHFRATEFAEVVSAVRRIELALVGDPSMSQIGVCERVRLLEAADREIATEVRKHTALFEKMEILEARDKSWVGFLKALWPVWAAILAGAASGGLSSWFQSGGPMP